MSSRRRWPPDIDLGCRSHRPSRSSSRNSCLPRSVASAVLIPYSRAWSTTSSPARASGCGGAALRDVADPPADADRVGDQVAAGHRGGAGGRLEQRGQHAQRRRLAGAVGAEEADDLPGLDVEVDADDGVDLLLALAEGAGEPAGVDHAASIAHGTDRSRASSPGTRLSAGRSPVAVAHGRPLHGVGCGRAPGGLPVRGRRTVAAGRADGGGAAAPQRPEHRDGEHRPLHARGRRPRAGRRAAGRPASAAVHSPSSRAARGSRRATAQAARSSAATARGRERLVEQPDEPVGDRLVRRAGRPASATAGRSPRRRWRCRRATAGGSGSGAAGAARSWLTSDQRCR